MDESLVSTFFCPDAANYAGQEGRMVFSNAVEEITLITDGNGAGQRVIGIITAVETTANGAAVSVCRKGKAKVKMSADHTLTKGTEWFGPNDSGEGHQVQAGYWVVGVLDGVTAPAAGELYDCIVQIQYAVAA